MHVVMPSRVAGTKEILVKAIPVVIFTQHVPVVAVTDLVNQRRAPELFVVPRHVDVVALPSEPAVAPKSFVLGAFVR
jgi:hypothetical protein